MAVAKNTLRVSTAGMGKGARCCPPQLLRVIIRRGFIGKHSLPCAIRQQASSKAWHTLRPTSHHTPYPAPPIAAFWWMYMITGTPHHPFPTPPTPTSSSQVIALERLGEFFNQQQLRLRYTPRKFVIHPGEPKGRAT